MLISYITADSRCQAERIPPGNFRCASDTSFLGNNGNASRTSFLIESTAVGAADPSRIIIAFSTASCGGCTPELLGAISHGPTVGGRPSTAASDAGVAMVPGP